MVGWHVEPTLGTSLLRRANHSSCNRVSYWAVFDHERGAHVQLSRYSGRHSGAGTSTSSSRILKKPWYVCEDVAWIESELWDQGITIWWLPIGLYLWMRSTLLPFCFSGVLSG